MTDRELLEAAAKAAGITLEEWQPEAGCFQIEVPWKYGLTNTAYWDPLTDDGDALRLAVKLKLQFFYLGGNKYFAGPSDSDKHGMRESGERNGVQDPYAATRRAIVRAAASIGEKHEQY